MSAPDGEEQVRAFARGLAVIEAMGAGPQRRTVAELAEATALPRSVVKRLLTTLCAHDYAQTDGKRYWPTPRVLLLGVSYVRSLAFWPYAQPALEDLRAETGESCSMGVLLGHEIVYILRVPSRRILAMSLTVGSRLPAQLVSIGQVLLAGLAEGALRDWLRDARFAQPTPRAVGDARALRRTLAGVRERGYAWVDGELDPAISGIAVPVRDATGGVVAAINVSLISGSFDERAAVKRFLVPLRRAAERIRTATPAGAG